MTAKPPAAAEAPHRFLESLYAFARHHLAVVNGVVLASGTGCAALNFLAPGLPGLILAVRLATALLVAAIVGCAVAPRLSRSLRTLFGQSASEGHAGGGDRRSDARPKASSAHCRRRAVPPRSALSIRPHTGGAGSQPRFPSLGGSRRDTERALRPGLRPGASSFAGRERASLDAAGPQLPLL
jgi:hypothetical protein